MTIIKTPEQVEGIRNSCQLLARIMKELRQRVKAGVTTRELNTFVEKRIQAEGATPAFKGYRAIPGGTAFPTALCASINDEVVHGIANSDQPLQEGDIIGMDLGVKLNGYYSDMAVTVAVGKIDPKIQQLLDITKKSLENGIAQMKPGNKVRDISQAIENTIKPYEYGIVREFVGHGVGLEVHEDPRIPNYVHEHMSEDLELVLKEGMVLAIEPMVTLGSESVIVLDDGWTVATEDGLPAAHFEHTIAITKNDHEILTSL